jgi:hypothetical protein
MRVNEWLASETYDNAALRPSCVMGDVMQWHMSTAMRVAHSRQPRKAPRGRATERECTNQGFEPRSPHAYLSDARATDFPHQFVCLREAAEGGDPLLVSAREEGKCPPFPC